MSTKKEILERLDLIAIKIIVAEDVDGAIRDLNSLEKFIDRNIDE